MKFYQSLSIGHRKYHLGGIKLDPDQKGSQLNLFPELEPLEDIPLYLRPKARVVRFSIFYARTREIPRPWWYTLNISKLFRAWNIYCIWYASSHPHTSWESLPFMLAYSRLFSEEKRSYSWSERTLELVLALAKTL
jgi:hypothetical protein